jgi:putative tricarboxylic transport membrane protein
VANSDVSGQGDPKAPATVPVTIDDIIEDEVTPGGAVTNIVAACVPPLIGVAGIWGSIRLGLGEPTAPGAGLWPFLISLVIAGGSIALLIGGRRFWDAEAFASTSLRVVYAVASLVAYAIALPYVGFEVVTVLLLFFWMRVLGRERWVISIVLPIVTTAVLWLLFVLLLRIPLPRLL